MVQFDSYNQDERTCRAHLFRFLHEGLAANPEGSGLRKFLGLLDGKDEKFQAHSLSAAFDSSSISLENARIYSDVGFLNVIYDAMASDTTTLYPWLDSIVDITARQLRETSVKRLQISKDSVITKYSDLPDDLKNPEKLSPRKLLNKMKEMKTFSADDLMVYSIVQESFNVKTDLMLMLDSVFVLVHINLLEVFDRTLLDRYKRTAELIREAVYRPFGYTESPDSVVITLGPPNHLHTVVTWPEVFGLALPYGENDRTSITFRATQEIFEKEYAEEEASAPKTKAAKVAAAPTPAESEVAAESGS